MEHGIITKPEMVTEPDPSEDPSGGSGSESSPLGQRGFIVNNGWIKIHRKILDWEWYSHESVFRVFVHLLLTANHEAKHWQGMTIKEGQKVTSYAHLASETGLSVQSVRTAISKLKSTGEITYESNNKYGLITISKWKGYQVKNTPTNTLANSQTTTNKKLKKRRREEEHLTSVAPTVQEPVNDFIGLFKEVNPSFDSLYSNTTQRASAERLLKRFGMEALKKLLTIIEKTNTMQYAPVITTPLELEKLGGKLKAFVAKEQSLKNKNKIISV